jgi:lipoprotein-releasing system ATP-binding protein
VSPLVEAVGVARTLPGPVPVTLVRDVDLAIGPGEFVAITGPSGSGKSSLLYLLGLLDRPTDGRVLIEGEDTAGLSAGALARIRRTRLGFVFQFHFLLPEFTALENLLVPMRRRGGDVAALRARAEALLTRFGLGDAMEKLPEQLSGGMRQRVAVARALANDPALILADEPTGNLDSANAASMFDLFESLVSEHGRSIVVVTHDPGLATRATRQVRLVDGRIVEDSGAPGGGRANPA